jgi:hypothetical protein
MSELAVGLQAFQENEAVSKHWSVLSLPLFRQQGRAVLFRRNSSGWRHGQIGLHARMFI